MLIHEQHMENFTHGLKGFLSFGGWTHREFQAVYMLTAVLSLSRSDF